MRRSEEVEWVSLIITPLIIQERWKNAREAKVPNDGIMQVHDGKVRAGANRLAEGNTAVNHL